MRRLVLILLFATVIVSPTQKAQAMDAKGKAFLIICGYGTVGGALLGFASMAFGSNSRAIAQGASLGLYTGIGFGAYVIASHQRSLNPPEPNYEPQQPPPGYGAPGGGVFGGGNGFQDPYGSPAPQNDGGFFGSPQRYIKIHEDLHYNYKMKNEGARKFNVPLYIPLLNTTF